TGAVANSTASQVVDLLTFLIGLPVVCLAIYVLYRQVRANQAAHVYVINLLISDVLQFVGRPSFLFDIEGQLVFHLIFWCGIVLSVSFMVCIAVERYLMIAHPHWYCVHCTVKRSILTSVVVWMGSIIIFALISISLFFQNQYFIFPALLILPFPLLLLLFVGTWRGLSKAFTLSTREKRRILATLALVIGNYTFIFLPYIVATLAKVPPSSNFFLLGRLLMFFSPLLDPVLYIFMRKDIRLILEDFPCCRKSCDEQEDANITPTVCENVSRV
uniref:G-protein coupled receptors family 1 profile domain-containing protein n=1 Tax=Scleropages formosus TaxID=113540 RepID=A0A8C9V618_SCLFO